MIKILFGFCMLITWYFLKYSPVKYHKKVISKYPLPKKEENIEATLSAKPDELLSEIEWKAYIWKKRNSPN